MLHVVVQEVANPHAHRIGQQSFHHLLCGTLTIHGNAGAQPEEENHGDQADGNRSGHEIWDWVCGIVRMDVDSGKERIGCAAEDLIQQDGKPVEMPFHSLFKPRMGAFGHDPEMTSYM